MAQDQQTGERARFPSGRIALAGMVIAAVLGAGLGVWARSAPMPEREVAEPEPPLQPLQIVVEDVLPPIGQLLEVLPPDLAAAAAQAGFTQEWTVARAEAAGAASPLPVVALRRAVAPETPVVARKPSTAKTVVTRAQARTVKAGPKMANATKDGAIKLAKATPSKAKAKSPARKPAAAKAPTRLAKAAPAKKKPPRLAKAPALKKATPAARPAPRGEGPLRVARNTCASPDPGAELVCADQRLGARDRQLQRAYRRAEAAGVPASALRRQEARWLDVRAAAAREAPWAVEDVYVARISEVNDMIRDAREN